MSTEYWLCCGSTEPRHNDDVAKGCTEFNLAASGRCRFGTAREHSEYLLGKIGYNWEDPERDIIAAVRQIQGILDDQIRSK